MQIDKIKGQIHNVPDHIHKKITDTSKTLLALLSFLKENDEKFTDFELFESVNLTARLDDDESSLIFHALSDSRKLSLAQMPNIEDFREIIISKGVSEEKLTIDTVKKLLNAALFMNKNNILGFMAYIIINKDKIDKPHQLNK